MERRPPPAPARPLLPRPPFPRDLPFDGGIPPRGPEFRPGFPPEFDGVHHPQLHGDGMKPPFREPFIPNRMPNFQVISLYFFVNFWMFGLQEKFSTCICLISVIKLPKLT